jgi:chlorite dismutase
VAKHLRDEKAAICGRHYLIHSVYLYIKSFLAFLHQFLDFEFRVGLESDYVDAIVKVTSEVNERLAGLVDTEDDDFGIDGLFVC